MRKNTETVDYLIVGGGLFGVYAALYLAGKGYRICLVEKEKALFRKASIVNQARLHGGYHYPRSIATAVMSDDHKERFTAEHRPFIHFSFEKYYAIDRFGSFTNAAQFERFCEYLSIRCEPVLQHPLIDFQRIEALFRTTEYTFDPYLIADHYTRRVQEASAQIDLRLFTCIRRAEQSGDKWAVELQDAAGENPTRLLAGAVINATYAGSNAVNRQFGLREIDLMHEISEIALLSAPALQGLGLTVMDGPFGSIMPFGKSGLHSLSSVAYTHHKVSYENLPHFDCQRQRADCRPDLLADCNECAVKPRSNYRKMFAQMKQYFRPEIGWQYFHSLFTIKSKLRANYIDDGRPTEINRLHDDPPFYCIFAGKINSIYEIEKVV